jgi:L-rhamnose mutarotase
MKTLCPHSGVWEELYGAADRLGIALYALYLKMETETFTKHDYRKK